MGGAREAGWGQVPATITRASPPFIGRQRQLQWLEERLRDALAGRPRVVLLPGEAGVGKTRLLRELRAIALTKNVQVFFGRCYEDLTLPYLPLVEALRSLPQAATTAPASADADAAIIQRLLDRVSAVAPAGQNHLSPQAEQDKLRLFLAVSRAIISQAQRGCVLLVVDDLHWADRPSIELFAHLSFALADASLSTSVPLMLVGSYRPATPHEDLFRTLARVEREEICGTLELAGLDESEVGELIRSFSLLPPAHQLVEVVNQATRGNPLFIQEVMHHLTKHGAWQQRGGHLVTTVPPEDLHLPDEVTAAIAARVHSVSEGCRRILTLASILGDRFLPDLLSAVSGVGEDGLLELLEEGMHQHLLLSDGPAFQFAHPLIRHVFYMEPSVARRQRLHHQVAQTLQRRSADGIATDSLEIAHHLVSAGPAAESEQLVEYAHRAGDEALGRFAWGQAARFYEAALAVAEVDARLPVRERAELHHRAGLAHFRNLDVGPGLDHYEKASEAYRLAGDTPGLARMLMERVRAKVTLASVPYGTMVDVQPLEDALAALGDSEPALHGQIQAMLAQVYWTAGQPEKAEESAQRGLEIGRRIKDQRLCTEASHALALAQIQSLQVREALKSWRNCVAFARDAGDPWLYGWPLPRLSLTLTALGQLDDATALAEQARQKASQIQDWAAHSVVLAALVSLAVARGEFAAAEQHAQEAMIMVRRSRYPWGGVIVLPALACGRCLSGKWAEAESALAMLTEPGVLFDEPGPWVQLMAWMHRQLIGAHAGRLADVKAQVSALPTTAQPPDRPGTLALPGFCTFVEIGERLGVPALAGGAYEALQIAAERGVVFSAGWGGWVFLIQRILGVAATLRGWWTQAEDHFGAGIEVAAATGARPELARTYLDYAHMLARRAGHDDRARAIHLLMKAIPLFNDLGMHPFGGRAKVLHEQLAARPAAAPGTLASAKIAMGVSTTAESATLTALVATPPPPARQTSPTSTTQPLIILFTDMADSTALIQRLGDAAAQALLRVHNSIIRTCLTEYGGSELKHLGDGMMVTFLSASNAVECAVAIQRGLAQHNQDRPEAPIRVRIGLNAGEPIAEDGELFGTAVNVAARICSRAQPGQILVSEVIRQLAAGKGITFAERGRVALKGFADRFRLYEVQW